MSLIGVVTRAWATFRKLRHTLRDSPHLLLSINPLICSWREDLILLYILGERIYDPIGLFSLHKRIFMSSILGESPADNQSGSNFKIALAVSLFL